MKTMKAGVIGLGAFGLNVARELFRTGWEVIALDRSKDLVQAAGEYAEKAVVADCTQKDVLADLGFANMDVAVVSMGDNLAGSVLAVMYLKELGVPLVIAKAANDDHRKVLEKVGADQVVSPEREMAVKIAHSLGAPNILDYLPLTGDFAVMEILVPRAFAGKTIMELDLRRRYSIQIMAVKRASGEVNVLVSPEAVINATDKLIVLGRQADVEKLRSISGRA